jgi:hypothetical protein
VGLQRNSQGELVRGYGRHWDIHELASSRMAAPGMCPPGMTFSWVSPGLGLVEGLCGLGKGIGDGLVPVHLRAAGAEFSRALLAQSLGDQAWSAAGFLVAPTGSNPRYRLVIPLGEHLDAEVGGIWLAQRRPATSVKVSKLCLGAVRSQRCRPPSSGWPNWSNGPTHWPLGAESLLPNLLAQHG